MHAVRDDVQALTKSGAKPAVANIRSLIELSKPYQMTPVRDQRRSGNCQTLGSAPGGVKGASGERSERTLDSSKRSHTMKAGATSSLLPRQLLTSARNRTRKRSSMQYRVDEPLATARPKATRYSRMNHAQRARTPRSTSLPLWKPCLLRELL